MKHILFISYDGLTDPLGQSQILPYLKGLTQFGYRFTIISCDKPDRYQQHQRHIRSLMANLPIRWAPLTYHKSPPVLSGIYDLRQIKWLAKKIYQEDPYDMVHTRSGTPAIAGLWLKKKWGVKFLNDVRDFYSYSRVDSGQWPQKNPVFRAIFKYFRRKEQEELAHSDGVVCLSHKAGKMIRESAQFPPGTPLEVIPCSVDMDLFDPEKVDLALSGHFRKQFGFTEGDLVFSYLGSVGTWYLAKEMFALFRIILKKCPEAKFLIISPDDKALIQAIAAEAGIPEGVLSMVSATRKEVPALLSLSRYSVFFIKPCYSKQASSPTKMGEIMAMNIPVITNSGVGDVKEIVEKYNAGLALDDFSESAFREAADRILSGHLCGKDIRQGALEYFDLAKAIASYRRIYDIILSP